METQVNGTRYQALVPDTLDLAGRAALAVHGIGGSIDPDLLKMYGLIGYCAPRPYMNHWASADVTCDTKFGESLPMMRVMSGSDEHLELESRYRKALCGRIQDGLYWDLYTPRRPWRNDYGQRANEPRDEDFCVVAAAGRMVRALLAWSQLEDHPATTEELARSLVHGMRRIQVCKDDYGYYPEKGGWGEDCTYPRSGWINTDEAQDDTEGREGGITAYQSHQIYGAARWYAVSGDPVALDLAARLSPYVMMPRFWGGVPDPNPPEGGAATQRSRLPDPPHTAGHELGHWFSHFHTRAIALRGLLEYTAVAEDARAMEFVRRSYEFTLTRGIPRMGWINTSVRPNSSFMEACALGDIIGLVLKLSWAGVGDYYNNAERWTRNHFAESQLLEEQVPLVYYLSGAQPPTPVGEHETAWRAPERNVGAFAGWSTANEWAVVDTRGIMHCCTDNAARALYWIWREALRFQDEELRVNLLLNRASVSR